jgi:hypothetical protein
MLCLQLPDIPSYLSLLKIGPVFFQRIYTCDKVKREWDCTTNSSGPLFEINGFDLIWLIVLAFFPTVCILKKISTCIFIFLVTIAIWKLWWLLWELPFISIQAYDQYERMISCYYCVDRCNFYFGHCVVRSSVSPLYIWWQSWSFSYLITLLRQFVLFIILGGAVISICEWRWSTIHFIIT